MTKIKWLKLLTGIFAGLSIVAAALIGLEPDMSPMPMLAPFFCALLCVGLIQREKREEATKSKRGKKKK